MGILDVFLSHYTLWQHIAQLDDDYTLILEDDVHISDDLPLFLADADWIPNDADVVKLSETTNYAKFECHACNLPKEYKLKKILSTVWCADAYILSKKGAQLLISESTIKHEPADAYLFSYEMSDVVKKLNNYIIDPALFCQDKYTDQVTFESNIEINNSHPIKRNLFLNHKIKKIVASLIGYEKIIFERKKF
jgi:glycosyl transferase family 25